MEIKRLYSPDKRDELAKSGAAMADGSYPIVDATDLKNAVASFGRAKDQDATKAHIIKRARALGATDDLPEDWKGKSDDATQEKTAANTTGGAWDNEGNQFNDLMNNSAARRERLRHLRLAALGFKDAESDSGAFLCAVDRKVLGGGASPCADCRGGCMPENDLPGLLDVEVIAQETIGGKVFDSGYAEAVDIFVVDVLREKDGQAVEVFLDGTGDVLGWHKLAIKADEIDTDGEIARDLISMSDAVEKAGQHIKGETVGIDADFFEGVEAYVVHMNGEDGQLYDVFVGIDGKVLGHDIYEDEDEDSDTQVKDDETDVEAKADDEATPDDEDEQSELTDDDAAEDDSAEVEIKSDDAALLADLAELEMLALDSEF